MAKAKSKGEIDKDIMYSKIMPTGLRKSAGDEADSAPPADRAAAQAAPPAPAFPAPAMAAQPRPEEGAPGFFNRAGVKLKEKSPMVVVNLMEYLVADKIDAAFEKFNCCKCDKCRKDVAALALNKLPPKYVVSERDHVLDVVARQSGAEVMTAIVQSILQVRSRPRH